MEELVEEIAHELRKRRHLNKFHHHVDRILKKKGLVDKNSNLRFFYINRNSPNCSLACKFVGGAASNIYGEEIGILVKSDHTSDKTNHRSVMVMIQHNTKKRGIQIHKRIIDKDHEGWKVKKVLRKEEREVWKDIDQYFREAA